MQPVFISTARKGGGAERFGSGDIDYAQALAEVLGADVTLLSQRDHRLVTPEEILGHIHEQEGHLHLIIRAPSVGFAFTPEHLHEFRQDGGKIVTTVMEFEKYQPKKPDHQFAMLEMMLQSNDLIFVDEADQRVAREFLQDVMRTAEEEDTNRAKSYFKLAAQDELSNAQWEAIWYVAEHGQELLEQINAAPVIPVPSTLALDTDRIQALREEAPEGHIISFGQIRDKKGIAEYVLPLAQMIGDSDTPEMQGKKVIICGNVAEGKTHNRRTEYDPTLPAILEAMYPQEFDAYKQQYTNDPEEAHNPVNLMGFHNTMQQAGISPAIPVELHTNVPEPELEEIFSRGTYAFQPANRGGTLRNASPASTLANGLITISHVSDITTDSLMSGGEHEGAMVLFTPEAAQHSGNPDAPVVTEPYVQWVFDQIVARERDPSLNADTLERQTTLVEELTSIAKVAEAHEEQYARAFGVHVSRAEEMPPPSSEAHR